MMDSVLRARKLSRDFGSSFGGAATPHASMEEDDASVRLFVTCVLLASRVVCVWAATVLS
jgi:hypothetical protein